MTASPLRILHIASGDLWGGAESQIHALLCRFAVAHPGLHTSAVILNEGELTERVRDLGVQVTVLDEKKMGPHELLVSITRLVRSSRPHIVHTHRQKENVLGAIAAAMGGSISLRTVHGAPEFTLTETQMAKRLFRFLNRLTARRMQAACVAVSSELASRLPTLLPGSTVVTINNGIDVEALRRTAAVNTEVPAAFNVAHICFIGRLVPVKRLDVFLQMAATLERRKPASYEFHVIGDGPKRTEVEALVKELRLESQCRFHGFRKDVPKLLAEMNALVLTSDHEGLPMTALEALALGVPVVAHGVGGLPELLRDNHESEVVVSQDPGKFADAVERVCWTRNRRTGGKSLLPQRYQIETTAAEYEQLYRRLLRP